MLHEKATDALGYGIAAGMQLAFEHNDIETALGEQIAAAQA